MKNKILLLSKTSISTLIGSSRISSGNKSADSRKKVFSIVGMMFLAVYMAAIAGFFSFALYSSLAIQKLQQLMPVLYAISGSLLILFSAIFSAHGFLYCAKDLQMLFSFPLKHRDILISKFLVLYLYNLLFSLMLIIPAGIVYSVFENLGIISYVNLVIIALFLPLLPVSIGGLISYFVGLVMRKLKNKSLINIAFSLVLFFGIMYISQNSDSILTYLTANGGNILDAISKYYFPAALILNALNGNILYALLFAALNILPLFLIFPLISRKYSVIVAGYNQVTHKNNYVLKTEKRASPFKSCLKKELSHLFSSANYLLNSASGALMLVVFTIMFVSQKGMQDSLTGLLGASGLGLVVSISAIFACTMTSTTSSAISLEGKTLWIYKSAPVTVLTIFKSKICVNIIINTPLSFIYTTVLSIVFKIPLANAILTTLLPIICIVFTSILGLLINLFN
ncbi:MAG: hypothetical protein RR246_05210, partial [Clostridia bacterium]